MVEVPKQQKVQDREKLWNAGTDTVIMAVDKAGETNWPDCEKNTSVVTVKAKPVVECTNWQKGAVEISVTPVKLDACEAY
jgi:hypothetical protein